MIAVKFIVTFGQKYSRVEHPFFKKAHPDGYVTVNAANAREARELITAWYGRYWSSLYDEEDFFGITGVLALYPLGELDRLVKMPEESVPLFTEDH